MFLRIDKLQIELPAPERQDPNAAAALQELLGGKYGEMSTLGNYMFQSFNFRSKSKLRPVLQPRRRDHRRGARPCRAGQQRRRHAGQRSGQRRRRGRRRRHLRTRRSRR